MGWFAKLGMEKLLELWCQHDPLTFVNVIKLGIVAYQLVEVPWVWPVLPLIIREHHLCVDILIALLAEILLVHA